MDAQGNFFGTNEAGGGKGCGGVGCGSVFELSPGSKKPKSWTERVHVFFPGMPDGARPYEGVVSDGKGTLYGTTDSGGDAGCYAGFGCGTVYKLKQ